MIKSNHSREGQLLNSDCASLPHASHERHRDLHYRLICSSTLVEQLYSVSYVRNQRLCRSIPFSTGSQRRLASLGFDSSRGEVQATHKWSSSPDSFIQPNLATGFMKSTDMLFFTLPLYPYQHFHLLDDQRPSITLALPSGPPGNPAPSSGASSAPASATRAARRVSCRRIPRPAGSITGRTSSRARA